MPISFTDLFMRDSYDTIPVIPTVCVTPLHAKDEVIDHQNYTSVKKPLTQLVTRWIGCDALSAEPTTSESFKWINSSVVPSGIVWSYDESWKGNLNWIAGLNRFDNDYSFTESTVVILASEPRNAYGSLAQREREFPPRDRCAKPEVFFNDQGIYGVDAAQMKIRKYSGLQIVLPDAMKILVAKLLHITCLCQRLR